jgi:maltooligosyltrehalose trehalohydrolase
MSAQRHGHAMPFGAETRPGAATRFRLWAPAAGRIDLVLASEVTRAELPMRALEAGWYECLAEAPAGTRYGYRIDGGITVPDPASRANPEDVHAASMVVDPHAFAWQDAHWRGRPWEQAVIYELHLGTFTPQGTFTAAIERLDDLAALGVTALELMPVADFPGRRNWGYDGVLPFAPDASYGTPDDLKRLVQAAHARGLMVLLDVVYNHFGPEGNYLHLYAPQFFNAAHHTPWGAAINFDGPDNRTVREFFVHNALYWIEEFRFDGLRLDAVHAIRDASEPDIVAEIGQALAAGPGRTREIHLVLENDANQSRYLARGAQSSRPLCATAQWNDDAHHALHVLATGEADGYYADYADAPLARLGRALVEGFVYQGEPSPFRGGAPRGEPSAHLPATAFVTFLQTHDQVGNRAFGERFAALAPEARARAALACLALSPQVPMFFMGEEFAASTPFLFFCDFGPELADAVAHGRREEFAQFAAFRDPAARARIPDPNDAATFEASRLRWDERERPPHRAHLERTAQLLALRHAHLVPRLAALTGGTFVLVNGALHAEWVFGDGARWHLAVNFSADPAVLPVAPRGEAIYAEGATAVGESLHLAHGGVHVSLER